MADKNTNETELMEFYNDIFKEIFKKKYNTLDEELAAMIPTPQQSTTDDKIGDYLMNVNYVGDNEHEQADDKSMQFTLNNLVYRKFEAYDDATNLIYFEEYDYETDRAIKMMVDNSGNNSGNNSIQYLYIDPSNQTIEEWKDINDLIKEKIKPIKNVLPEKYVKLKTEKLTEHYKTVRVIVSKRTAYLENFKTKFKGNS